MVLTRRGFLTTLLVAPFVPKVPPPIVFEDSVTGIRMRMVTSFAYRWLDPTTRPGKVLTVSLPERVRG